MRSEVLLISANPKAAPFPVLEYFEHCSGMMCNGVHAMFYNTSYTCSQVKIELNMAENLMPFLLLDCFEEETACESDDFFENVMAVTTAL